MQFEFEYFYKNNSAIKQGYTVHRSEANDKEDSQRVRERQGEGNKKICDYNFGPMINRGLSFILLDF